MPDFPTGVRCCQRRSFWFCLIQETEMCCTTGRWGRAGRIAARALGGHHMTLVQLADSHQEAHPWAPGDTLSVDHTSWCRCSSPDPHDSPLQLPNPWLVPCVCPQRWQVPAFADDWLVNIYRELPYSVGLGENTATWALSIILEKANGRLSAPCVPLRDRKPAKILRIPT